MAKIRWLGVMWGLLAAFQSIPEARAAPQDVPSAASFYVPSLPDIHQDPNHPLKIFAGHLPADPNASKAKSTDVVSQLFFVMIKNRRIADRQRLMFWFNGGPGCSSFDGLMMEVGPWRMDGKGGFKTQEGGWEEYTTMVYIDQPAGTGFSVASTDRYVHTLDEASTQLLEFLRNFYLVFPEYKNVDTYLGGESFAGQWIPAFADAILNSHMGIPLRGAAIGNGWIDPRRQYPAYLEFAVKVGLLEENSDAWKEAKKITDHCVAQLEKIKGTEPMEVKECARLVVDVVKNQNKKVKDKDMCLNIYDVRLHDEAPACGMNWPPDIHPITTYLDRKDVVNALHANAHSGSWIECRNAVHLAFHESKENASVTILPRVLAKIPVLIFAGDQDLICNYVGLEAMIKEMAWNGATGLGTVKTQSWNVNNTPAGTWVTSRNLTYTKIFNASHMAPFDVPHVTHDMILRFMGFNFSAIFEGSARIPSSLGTVKKPIFVGQAEAKPTKVPIPGKTPEQDKAMWEAYYNAGSAALVLILIFAAIGIFVWCRVRRRHVRLPINANEEEESIPLNTSRRMDDEEEDPQQFKQRKGKERAKEPSVQLPIFDVGESDEEDEGPPRHHND
ncbi:Pheromone-processing carboxypeptidase KEX1 [Hypsizygus marmoreus]|uniref:Pheromone-processing carboxypeptidase KEX1 n=1 Tax=Hypsizygus marmoreus TaxID=39966 RepID=A0A369JEP3_HYPMA|nr:Pheromone-processing carboxypeptidase KEX1 [Hypsizygus marmoreus]